jgi:hypothetical protein
MSIAFELAIVPLVYLGLLGWLAATRRRQGILVSVACFAATLVAGVWGIFQSRSSTAAIGLIFLPVVAGAAGLLGLAYGRTRVSTHWPVRRLGRLALLGAVALPGAEVASGWRSIQRNTRRDAEHAEHVRAVAANRTMVATMLRAVGSRRGDSLGRLVRLHIDDRDFLIAALEREELSPGLLDTLAGSGDQGIALLALRNPTTRGETLTRVYRTSSYPEYFYQTLAAHRHTPPEILREIRGRGTPITGLDIWFAGNPATPKDILDEISRTSASAYVIRSLLRNPAIDCRMARQVAIGPAVAANPKDDDLRPRAAELEAVLCRLGDVVRH